MTAIHPDQGFEQMNGCNSSEFDPSSIDLPSGDFSFVGPDNLPTFDNEVAEVHEGRVYECKRGIVTEEVYEMTDGTMYPLVSGSPSPSNLISDTSVVFTTAWMTSTKGHNRRTTMGIAEAGYKSKMIGPEGEVKNPNLSFQERVRLAATTSLPKIAHDMNRILDRSLSEEDTRQDEVIAFGESRAAMLAPGFNIEKYSGSRRLVYADLDDPCFKRAAKFLELPQVVGQLFEEAPVLGRLALQLPLQARGRHYLGTVHKDPEYYFKEAFKVPQLLSGQAGLLHEASRPETHMRIVGYKNTNWAQSKEWKKLFAQNPWVRYIESEGLHLNIADESILDDKAARLRALAEMRGFDGSFSKISFDEFEAIKDIKSSKRQKRKEEEEPLPIAA